MTDFMQYVWMQYPTRPANTTGVDVTITVLDPNNNVYQVATATSDSNGFYSTNFTPEVPGQYTVTATFSGTKSFYGSHAETAINVESAHPTAAPTETSLGLATTNDLMMYMIPSVIAIIIAIAIVGILLFKKKA
jgi:hypothetical protein